jgi:hypothetical protein
MTINPHPFVLVTAARQRGAELQAEVDRVRLAKLAQGDIVRWQPGAALPAVVAAALATALLLMAGSAAAQESSPQVRQGLVLATDDADANAVQKVREAAN